MKAVALFSRRTITLKQPAALFAKQRIRQRPIWQSSARCFSSTLVDDSSIPGVVTVSCPPRKVSDPVIQVGIMAGIQGTDLQGPTKALEMFVQDAKSGKLELPVPGTTLHLITGNPDAIASQRISELYKFFSEPVLSGSKKAEASILKEVGDAGRECTLRDIARATTLAPLLQDLNVLVDLRGASDPPSDPYVKVAGKCTSKHMLVASHFLPFKLDINAKPRKIRLVHDAHLHLSEGTVSTPDEFVGSNSGVSVVAEVGSLPEDMIYEQCRHLIQNLLGVEGLEERGPVKAPKWEDWYPVKLLGVMLPPKYNMAFLPYGVQKPYRMRGDDWKWAPDVMPLNFGKLAKSSAAGHHYVDGQKSTKYTPRRTTMYLLPSSKPDYVTSKPGDVLFWPLKYFRVAGFNTVGKAIRPRELPDLDSMRVPKGALSTDKDDGENEALKAAVNLNFGDQTKTSTADKVRIKGVERMVTEWNKVGFLNMLTDSKMLFKRNAKDKEFTIVDELEASEVPDFVTEDINFRQLRRPKPVMGERAAPDLMTILQQYNQYMQQRPTTTGQMKIPTTPLRTKARHTTPEDIPYLLTKHFFHFPNEGNRGNPVVVYPSLFRQEDTIPVRLEKPYKSQSIQFDFEIYRSVQGNWVYLGYYLGEEHDSERNMRVELIEEFLASTPKEMFKHVSRPSTKADGKVVDYIGFEVKPTCMLKWYNVGTSNHQLAEVMVEGQEKDDVASTYVALAETLLCLNSLRDQGARKLSRTFLLFDDRGKNMYPSPMLPLVKDWLLDTDVIF